MPLQLAWPCPHTPRAGRTQPSISLSPTGVTAPGADVTIRCQGQRWDVRFFLHKAGDLNPQRHIDPAGDGAEFRIPTVGRQHRGNYSCSYRPRSEPFVSSQPSDPVQLVVAGEGPSISLSPTGVIASGANVTIRCQGQRWDVRFFLHKAGDLNPQRHMDPAGDGAKFRIPTVGRQHRGNYSCSYRPRSEPFVSSEPSDPVQLVVAGEGPSSTSPLPAPHRAGPSEGASALMGRSEPSSALSPELGTSCWGAATGDSGLWDGGSLPPGGAAEHGACPRGMLPQAAHALGMHRGVGAQGLPSPSHKKKMTLMIDAALRGGDGTTTESLFQPHPGPVGRWFYSCRKRLHDLAHHRRGERGSRPPPPPPCGLRLLQKNPSQ
uniref:Ig-like domain-containing protein n=1 Tax=Chrysemys picta bellii TaxID=8478 RepID=A0A8C3FDH0_CHRPI